MVMQLILIVGVKNRELCNQLTLINWKIPILKLEIENFPIY